MGQTIRIDYKSYLKELLNVCNWHNKVQSKAYHFEKTGVLMRRICPSCKEKGIQVLPLMFWSTRCRCCGIKAYSNPKWGFALNGFVVIVLSLFVYLTFRFLGLTSIVVSFGIYLVSQFLIEVLSPIAVKER